MKRARSLAMLACAFGLSCGLSAVGTVPASPGEDGGVPATQPDGAIALPPGWAFVSVGEAGSSCPDGFSSPAEVVGDALARADACECAGCTLVPPTCAGHWNLDYSYGTNDCATQGTRSYYANDPPGSCGTDMSTGDHTGRESKFFGGQPPAGGSCTAGAVITHADRVDATHAVVCYGAAPSATRACIAHEGDAACPSDFADKKTYGDGVDVVCPPCTCQLAAPSCVVVYYPTNDCMGTGQKMPADGMCHDTGLVGSDYSYRIVGEATCSLVAAAPAASTVSSSLRTVCCR